MPQKGQIPRRDPIFLKGLNRNKKKKNLRERRGAWNRRKELPSKKRKGGPKYKKKKTGCG